MFTVGKTLKEVETALDVWRDAMTITVLSKAFGGVRHMAPAMVDFIVNWEVESYRAKVSLASGAEKKLNGKIAIVTGSAQGFGAGIAEYLASEGAAVVIADMNYDGARATAERIAEEYKTPALAVSANVSDEDSVREMIERTVLTFGGLDVFVNNAGIVRAGSLEDMTKKNFELVASVNYTAYFLCAKYSSAVMKKQREISPEYMAGVWSGINSEVRSVRLQQELCICRKQIRRNRTYPVVCPRACALRNRKVNAVCPGNFLDGPLWSDPEKGLFVQYLKAGKVPGAKTVADVRARSMKLKSPLFGRGCRIEDVAKAVLYIIDQKYETGQAVPVTGGQEMLK